jgi:Holliday junction resolvasome RuvABC endonuclease subunit
MKILAFDQSTNLTGWSLFDNGQYVDSGVIDKHKVKDSDQRIAEMGLAMCRLIKEYRPDTVTIEATQKQSNIKTVIYLAQLQGCIILYCASKGIKLNILHPTEWRSVLSYKQGPKVRREELKQQSIDYVKEHLGFDNFTEDQCEACCIGMATQKILDNTK